MTISPLAHGGEDRPQIPALVGEPVVIARRMLRIRHPHEHSGIDESCQAVPQNIARDPEPSLEVLEARDPQERVPDRPACSTTPRPPRGTAPPSSPYRRSSCVPRSKNSGLHHKTQSPRMRLVMQRSERVPQSGLTSELPPKRRVLRHGPRGVHGLLGPVDRERGFPGARASVLPRLEGGPGVGDHRLQHRVRVSARDRRPHRRQAREQAGLLRRPDRVHVRIGTVRASHRLSGFSSLDG